MTATLYYSGDGIEVWHGPWQQVWATRGLAHSEVDLLWADPPYGAREKMKRSSRARTLEQATEKAKVNGQKAWARARDWKPLHGDNQAFDPTPLLAFTGKKIIWGANYFSHLLPPSRSWLWWDKREEGTPDDNGDGELAWTTLGGPPRQLPFKWRGLIRRGVMNGLPRQHPTEKPPELSTWAFGLAKLQAGNLVFSSHLGSGPEVLSALEMGLRLVGCEVEEEYCKRAVARILRRRVGGARAHAPAHGQQSMEFPPPLTTWSETANARGEYARPVRGVPPGGRHHLLLRGVVGNGEAGLGARRVPPRGALHVHAMGVSPSARARSAARGAGGSTVGRAGSSFPAASWPRVVAGWLTSHITE